MMRPEIWKTIIDPCHGSGTATSIEHDAVNRRTQRTLPNGVVTTYEYKDEADLDVDDLVRHVQHKFGTAQVLSRTAIANPGTFANRPTNPRRRLGRSHSSPKDIHQALDS